MTIESLILVCEKHKEGETSMILKKLDKNFKIALITLILTTIAAGIFGGFTLLISKTGVKLLSNGTVNTLIIEIIVLIVPCLVVKKCNGGKFNLELIFMKFRAKSLSDFFKGMGVSVLMLTIFLVTLILTGIMNIKGFGFEFDAVNKVLLTVFLGFLVAIFAGFCEEIFFRGVLLNYLSKWKGNIIALILSSLIFTAFHITHYQDVISLSNVFIMGVWLGYMLIMTKSLYVSIGLHFAWDFYLSIFGTKGDPSLFILSTNDKLGVNFCNEVAVGLETAMPIIAIAILSFISIKRKKLEKGRHIDA